MKATLLRYYRALRKHFGKRDWWPGDTPFEVMVGAILTQNTNWGNVEKAIANLKSADLLHPEKIANLPFPTLAAAIRPAGYYRLKAKRLRNLVTWMLSTYGTVKEMKKAPTERLREELLSVNGVGPETADSILLYALRHPIFVVDTYTYRVLSRHGLVDGDVDYDSMKDLFESHVNPKLFNDYHAQLVMVGKDFCRPTAKCNGCPLEKYLP